MSIAKPVADFAALADAEPARIDAGTTIRTVRDQLRRNAAWFHLTRGIDSD